MKQYITHFTTKEQIDTISSSGAIHQNTVAEQSIKTVLYMARTMLILAAIKRPTENITTPDFWTMTMDCANWIYNHLRKFEIGLSPDEILTRSDFTLTKVVLICCHVLGAPTYVLEQKLQKSVIELSKWTPRSYQGVLWSSYHIILLQIIVCLTE